VLAGDEKFFRITKRIHNRLHGSPEMGPLGIDAPNNLARAGWEYLPLFVLFASQQRDARDACFAAETASAPADAGPEHASPTRQEIDTA
jgi:hypothetical protein